MATFAAPIRRAVRLLAVLLPVAFTGCHKPAAAPVATVSYAIQGKVIALDASTQSITLSNDTIPGFMEAMTMDYRVDNPAALTEMHPGDRISATLLADKGSDGASNFRLHEIVITGQARPDYKPTVVYHVPEAGETMPDFKLLNQSGRAIDLKQYRGKAYAMTFIYTRCPLADYCPRMSRNFDQIDKELAKDSKVYANTHLLSVSFDPTYDTPKVLKSYGGGVTGKFTNETFKHWDFAAPQGPELLAMEKWFAVGVTPGENGTLSHSLATAVVGPDGKVIAFYPSNDWKPEDVLAQLRAAAAGNAVGK
jgi:protein SCO1/2